MSVPVYGAVVTRVRPLSSERAVPVLCLINEVRTKKRNGLKISELFLFLFYNKWTRLQRYNFSGVALIMRYLSMLLTKYTFFREYSSASLRNNSICFID